MKLETQYRPETGSRRYVLDISYRDWCPADLDPFDLMLIRDVEKNAGDSGTPIADCLLALQVVVLRVEQAARKLVQ